MGEDGPEARPRVVRNSGKGAFTEHEEPHAPS